MVMSETASEQPKQFRRLDRFSDGTEGIAAFAHSNISQGDKPFNISSLEDELNVGQLRDSIAIKSNDPEQQTPVRVENQEGR